MSKFEQDLARGEAIEKKLIEVFRKKYPSATLVHQYKGYDIYVPENRMTYEVKYDAPSLRTGNYAIEIECNGKPSGLLTTEADYWVIYDDVNFFIIRTKELINFILLNNLQWQQFKVENDTSVVKIYLVKKHIVAEFGKLF